MVSLSKWKLVVFDLIHATLLRCVAVLLSVSSGCWVITFSRTHECLVLMGVSYPWVSRTHGCLVLMGDHCDIVFEVWNFRIKFGYVDLRYPSMYVLLAYRSETMYLRLYFF